MRDIKTKGQVFTPTYLVKEILNYGGYYGTNIVCKHIIDNSCGDGAFLVEIVERYCIERKGTPTLQKELETYIHGIEIDKDCWQQCIERLNEVVKPFGIHNVQWDIQCADALTITKYNGTMDYVVGNPPYVRVHNLENYTQVKQYTFAGKGMIDLYLVFMELGIRMLAPTGVLCEIMPSSWLTSGAGQIFRDYLRTHRQLSGIIDLEHFMPFEATTYTLIAQINGTKRPIENIDFCTYNGTLHPQGTLTWKDIYIGNAFYFSPKETLKSLRAIRETICPQRVLVKNGFATLADEVFINDTLPKEKCNINILKASTGKWHKCIFPYDVYGTPLPLSLLQTTYPATYAYLLTHQEKLLARDSEREQWYLFGRTQALKDVCKSKIALNTLVHDINSIKITSVQGGEAVYSGLYILTKVPYNIIEGLLKSADFIQYVSALKNYKNGGYYTFSSTDVQCYLNYKLQQYYG